MFADSVNEFRCARVREYEPAVEAARMSAASPPPLGAEFPQDMERMQLNLDQIECCFRFRLSPDLCDDEAVVRWSALGDLGTVREQLE
jgi:hypothetical protein